MKTLRYILLISIAVLFVSTVNRTSNVFNSLFTQRAKVDTVLDYDRGLKDNMGNLINPPHAWMRFADSSVTPTITQNVWQQVTNDNDSIYRVLELSGGWTFDGDTLFAPYSSHVIVMFELSFEVGSNNNAEVRVMTTNNGEIAKVHDGTGIAGEDCATSCFAYWNVDDAGDGVWFEYRNTSDNGDFDLLSSIVTVWYFHPIY